MTKNEFSLQMKYTISLKEVLCILPPIHKIWLFLVRHFAMTFHRLMVVWLPLTLRTFSIYQQCQKMGRSITVLRREKWSRKYHEYWIVCAISLQTYFAILKRFWPTFLHFHRHRVDQSAIPAPSIAFHLPNQIDPSHQREQ